MKDFAWHKAKDNPLWRESEKINWKKRIEITIGLMAVLATVYLGIFSPVFHINKIEVEGLQRIKKETFVDSVDGVINYKKLFVLPGNSFFLVDLDQVIVILKSKFSLNSISIQKRFPNLLQIKIEEKISTIIYDNSADYSYLDADGKQVELLRRVGMDEWQLVSPATSSTEAISSHKPQTANIVSEFGDYPIIYDKRHVTSALNQQVLSKEMVSGVINWFNFIKKNNKIKLSYFIIENDLGEGLIVTGDGWLIKANLKNDIETQYNELEYLLKEKIDYNKLNYIDLRYLGKVYWQ